MSQNVQAIEGTQLSRWSSNIRESGRSPGKCACGFIFGWGAFFFILWVMPNPEGLLAPARQPWR
jgi:hypothetical protein